MSHKINMSSAKSSYSGLEADLDSGYDVGISGGSSELCPFDSSDIDSEIEWLDGWRLGNDMLNRGK